MVCLRLVQVLDHLQDLNYDHSLVLIHTHLELNLPLQLLPRPAQVLLLVPGLVHSNLEEGLGLVTLLPDLGDL